MRKCLYFFYFVFFFFISALYPFQLDRVILATNDNAKYIQFWPIAARAWREIVGVRPTLALVAADDVAVDETLGDVIRFKPLPGVPTSLYAQCIRLLLPALFPDDFCIVSDIDLLPLQKQFFTKYIQKVPADCFVIYRDHYYWFWKPRIYMNYNAAKGSVFGEIFGVNTMQDIPRIIEDWYYRGIGWSTDEKLLYRYIQEWKKQHKHRVKNLGFWPHRSRRISRKENCSFNEKKLKKGQYIELNCPRPYEEHKGTIDYIMKIAFLAARRSKS